MAVSVKNSDTSSWSLKGIVNRLEDGVITLSGPALAISGIIAGVDLLTGGSMLKIGWLSFIWAACLMLTLDFQVLVLGARAHQVYQSADKGGWRKCWEILLICLIAAAIASISVQMQAIVSKANSQTPTLSIDQAAAAIGVSLNWLIWERSALVLVLIFHSGWFKERSTEVQSGVQAVQSSLSIDQVLEQVQKSNQEFLGQVLNQVLEQVNRLNRETMERLEQGQLNRLETVMERTFERVTVSLVQQTQSVLPAPSAPVELLEPAKPAALSVGPLRLPQVDPARFNECTTLFKQMQDIESEPVQCELPHEPVTEPVPVPGGSREGTVDSQVVHAEEDVNPDTGSKVQGFIVACLQQGFTPTLGQIMAETGCAKGTAIKYRRLLCSQQEGA